MTARGKGHLADRAEDIAMSVHVSDLIGAPARIPLEIDATAMLEEIPDQLATSSCVGQALATSIYLRAKDAGHPIERPSALAIYAIARAADAPHHHLVDDGSRPTVAIREAKARGMVASSRWPFVAANVNVPPPLGVFDLALAARLGESYRIPRLAGAAALARAALAAGHFPIFAMSVDQAYEDYDGRSVYGAPQGPSLGGHMQTAIGYRADGSILVANSWGKSWGRGGFGLISASFFDSAAVSDILVPTVVPLSLA